MTSKLFFRFGIPQPAFGLDPNARYLWSFVGSDITAGNGFDILGSPSLLDGILDDVIF